MNNKGFTLIELLAVIVILAIIALIATPIILNIINEARNASRARTAELVVSQVETAYSAAYMLNGNAPTLEQVAAKFTMDGASMADDGTITVTMKNVDCTTTTPTENNVTSLVVSCTGGGKTKATPAGLELGAEEE